MSTEIQRSAGSFCSLQAFEDAQRIAKCLQASSLVPKAYQENLSDCIIALDMAARMNADPLMIMQNLYVIHGRPSWSSQFLIAAVNNSGRFSPIRYEFVGTPHTDDWGCRAWAKDESGERLDGPLVTIAMAKAEGWYAKNGSKWKTLPELMLTYRAATFFARTHAPELTMGLPTREEAIDIGEVETTARVVETSPLTPGTHTTRKPRKQAKPKVEDPAEDEGSDAEAVARGKAAYVWLSSNFEAHEKEIDAACQDLNGTDFADVNANAIDPNLAGILCRIKAKIAAAMSK